MSPSADPPPPGPPPSAGGPGGYGVEPFPTQTPRMLPTTGGYASPHEGPASQTMAVWALVVSFCGVGAIVGAVLAIVVLVRSRDGRDHGKVLAVIALVVAPVVLTLTVLGLVAERDLIRFSVSDDPERGTDGQVTEEAGIAPSKLRVGDCFDDTNFGSDEEGTTVVEIVPCTRPHQYEAFHLLTLPDGDGSYPGIATMDRAAEACFPAFRTYVGSTVAQSRLEVSYYYPTSESWRRVQDRGIVCLVEDPEQERLLRSLAGSRR